MPRVSIDDEGYDVELKDIWPGDEGYDVWGADEPRDSSDSKSVRSVINIIESPEIIMPSSDETEGDGMVTDQSKGSAEEASGVLDQKQATTMIQILNRGEDVGRNK